MPKEKHRLLKNFLVLFISLLLIFLFFEVGLRIAYPQDIKFIRFHPYLGHELIPNKETRYSRPALSLHPEYSHSIRINSAGQRENKIYNPETIDTYRIAMLGSSFTLGLGVEQEQTFSKRLEQKLQNIDANYEVINFGIQGSAPDTQYLNFITKVKDYHPDLVIMNIVSCNIANPPSLFKESKGKLTYTPLPEPSMQLKLRSFLSEHFHSWIFLVNLLNSNSFTKNLLVKAGLFAEPKIILCGPTDPETYRQAFSQQSKIVQKIAQFAKQKNIDFLVNIIPIKEQIDSQKHQEAQNQGFVSDFLPVNQPEEDLYHFLQKNPILVIRLSPIFKEKNINNSFYFEIDGHWNSKGHELAAEILYQHLIFKKWNLKDEI